ncbi:hypothetical protein GE061_007568 [Apolygus lucorum]|uniref:Multidrug resistance-associated protein lethal(2)03659 n=1 Tax=Apolygus lucorum TaxID=248454 RepID=A0A8S9WS22_APOLU|nr:hypothetical protein GE061_007568 [Apolygus lucorum]
MDTRQTEKPKPPNPFENAHVLSRLFFCWGVPLLRDGNKRALTDDDICEPMSDHASRYVEERITKAWNDELDSCKRSGKTPHLVRAVIRLFGPRYAVISLVTLVLEMLPFVQVYCLYILLQYYAMADGSQTSSNAIWAATGIVLNAMIKGCLMHSNIIRSLLKGMKIRVTVSTLLYQKVLRLSRAKKSKFSSGFIINLFAIDSKKLENSCHMLMYMVVAPLQITISLIMMWLFIGWPSVIGTAFSVLCVFLQLFIAKRCSVTKHEIIKKADVRIRIMNEIISGMQVLKMYAWEDPFADLIFAARKEELNSLRKALWYRVAGAMSLIYRSRIAVFFVLLTCAFWNGEINSVKVYVAVALFNTYQIPVSQFMTKGTISLGESLLSLQRMTDFLLSDEDDARMDETSHGNDDGLNILNSSVEIDQEAAVSIRGLKATWSEDAAEPVLCDVNLDFPRGELTAVVGAVGSGKSSLIQAILGEMNVKKGSVRLSGSVSYAAQEPWVFQGSLRNNVIFGEEFESSRYNRVIRACALDKDLATFPDGDLTIVGERGVMLSGGQKARVGLARAVYRNAETYLLDDPLSAVDVKVGKLLFDECIQGVLHGKTVVLVTHQLQALETVKRIVLLDHGTVKTVGSYSDLVGIGHGILPENKEQHEEYCNSTEKDVEVDNASSEDMKPSMEPEHKLFESVTGTPWIYLKSGGPYWSIVLLFSIFMGTQISGSFYDYWLNHWVKIEDRHQAIVTNIEHLGRNISGDPNISVHPKLDDTMESCLIVLAVVVLYLLISASFQVLDTAHFCTRASQTIHAKMFNAVLRTPMLFFNTNTSGRILNRFSQELSTVDEILSEVFVETSLVGLYLVGTMVMVLIVNPFIIAIIALCAVVVLTLKTFYVRTSVQLKKLESASRSPVIAHVNQTLNGLLTIRALSAQDFVVSEFHKHQDHNAGAQFQFLGLARSYGYWIECIGLVYTFVVVASLLILNTGAANVGLAITQILSMATLLQFWLRLIVDLENALTSVERTTEYAQLPSEVNWQPSTTGDEIGFTWPEQGKINFVDVSFRYKKGGPKVLENLNFTVLPMEKIGIVGRTGAGKSSLISALFRMAELEGRIEIDDVDTSVISLHTLRSRISIIPQDPVLFSGTLRKNIDPFNEYSDDKLWTALEEVELKDVVSSLPNGLETEISEGGGNLSVGQKQLVCLARAIVRNNKILVLDEATANVDHKTDALIQKTIRNKFSDNTVLTVAHRLITVMDSDKILVISNGKAVEFDHPHILLQNENGYLSKMVSKCGKITENSFRTTAEENYNNKRKQEDRR